VDRTHNPLVFGNADAASVCGNHLICWTSPA